jgi:hypothetical protein
MLSLCEGGTYTYLQQIPSEKPANATEVDPFDSELDQAILDAKMQGKTLEEFWEVVEERWSVCHR